MKLFTRLSVVALRCYIIPFVVLSISAFIYGTNDVFGTASPSSHDDDDDDDAPTFLYR